MTFARSDLKVIYMPCKYSVKQYKENGYYHIFNRGVEKRIIFQDRKDHLVFLSYLKTYLKPKDALTLQTKLGDNKTPWPEKSKIIKLLRLNNFHGEIKLLCYCLMPNHFHFLIKQKSASAIDSFMQSFCTRYSLYFNKTYKRVGPLFQGKYKAVLVKSDEQLLHLSRYIHLNPARSDLAARSDLEASYSSYKDYLKKRETSWVNTKEVLSLFSEENPNLSYKSFVEDNEINSNTYLKKITFE